MNERDLEKLQRTEVEGLTAGILTVVQLHPDVEPEGRLVRYWPGINPPLGAVSRDMAPYGCEAYDLLFPGEAIYVYDRRSAIFGKTKEVDLILENDGGHARSHPLNNRTIESLRQRGIVIKGRLI